MHKLQYQQSLAVVSLMLISTPLEMPIAQVAELPELSKTSVVQNIIQHLLHKMRLVRNRSPHPNVISWLALIQRDGCF